MTYPGLPENFHIPLNPTAEQSIETLEKMARVMQQPDIVPPPCASTDSEVFFASSNFSKEERHPVQNYYSSRPSRLVCGGCALALCCAADAVTRTGRTYGVWGGMGERERREIEGMPAEQRLGAVIKSVASLWSASGRPLHDRDVIPVRKSVAQYAKRRAIAVPKQNDAFT